MKIGVFDSGIGGKNVAEVLEQAFPTDTILYANDHGHVPYGARTSTEIQQLTEAALSPLFAAECDVIVIACNTATTNAISTLRTAHPEVFFVGLEPMVKPAAQLTHSKIVAVCATDATRHSSSYQSLKKQWANETTIIEPDCSQWAGLIENYESHTIDVEGLVSELAKKNCDVIVLACTHYHWLKKRFEKAAPHMTILEPTDAIIARIDHFKKDYKAFTAFVN